MSAISETIVREFLEANGFLVQQGRKFVAPSRRHDSHIDFFASNPSATESKASLPFELKLANLKHIRRAGTQYDVSHRHVERGRAPS